MKLAAFRALPILPWPAPGKTLPDNIRLWTRRNLAVAEISKFPGKERHHAQRGSFYYVEYRWKNNYFEAIDPVAAGEFWMKGFMGMERVKQRIIGRLSRSTVHIPFRPTDFF